MNPVPYYRTHLSSEFPEDRCMICLSEPSELLNKRIVIAHPHPTRAHELIHNGHKECLEQWWEGKPDPSCPTCHAPVDLNSFIPLKERVVKRLTLLMKDLGLGIKVAALLNTTALITFTTVLITLKGMIMARGGLNSRDVENITFPLCISLFAVHAVIALKTSRMARTAELDRYTMGAAAGGGIALLGRTFGRLDMSTEILVLFGTQVAGAIAARRIDRRGALDPWLVNMSSDYVLAHILALKFLFITLFI